MARRKKVRVGDWVVVHWIDAISNPSWVDLEKLEEEARCPDAISKGCLVVDNERQITLASTFATGQAGEILSIPKGMVVKIVREENA